MKNYFVPAFLITGVILTGSILGFKYAFPGLAAANAVKDTTKLTQLYSGSKLPNMVKMNNIVIDDARRQAYFCSPRLGNVGILDLNTDKMAYVADVSSRFHPGASLFIFEQNNKFYLLAPDNNTCYEFDAGGRKLGSAEDVKNCSEWIKDKQFGSASWDKYKFEETGFQRTNDYGAAGFPIGWRQDLDANYGVIDIKDSSDGKKLGEIIHGPDALYFAVDQKTGKLYAVNTGDGSLSVFDLSKLSSTGYCRHNKCWLKNIKVGTTAEQIFMDSKNNIYVRNRLGGSAIFKYNVKSKSLFTLKNEVDTSHGAAIFDSGKNSSGGIGMWPTGMALSQDEKKLYVFSHLTGVLDIFNNTTNKVSRRVDLYPRYLSQKLRTDGISATAYDRSRDRFFIVAPELAVLLSYDGKTGKIATVDLSKYGLDAKKSASGPGLVHLAVSGKRNKLYVYLRANGKILAFNSQTMAKEQEAAIAYDTSRTYDASLVMNDAKDVLYFQNKILNAATLAESGSYSSGIRVLAYDNGQNLVYLSDFSKGADGHEEKVYEYKNSKLNREWMIDPKYTKTIPASFWFDFSNRVFYAAYFESGIMQKFDLDKGSAPAAAPKASDQCDYNKDGKVDATEQAKCNGAKASTASLDCDYNKDGKVDATEQGICASK